MADYIKREDVLAKKQTIYFEYFDSDSGYVEEEGDLAVTVEDILKIPATDVRPVVLGRWNRTDAYPHRLYCSVCYKTYLKNDELLERWEFPLNFCPNCGADMGGEGDV